MRDVRVLAVLAVLIGVANVGTCQTPGGVKVQTATIERGDLSVLLRDNSESPRVLSGIDSLFNTKDATSFDAFDPTGKGSSAGLNFEHIISGHNSPNNKFAPRSG